MHRLAAPRRQADDAEILARRLEIGHRPDARDHDAQLVGVEEFAVRAVVADAEQHGLTGFDHIDKGLEHLDAFRRIQIAFGRGAIGADEGRSVAPQMQFKVIGIGVAVHAIAVDLGLGVGDLGGIGSQIGPGPAICRIGQTGLVEEVLVVIGDIGRIAGRNAHQAGRAVGIVDGCIGQQARAEIGHVDATLGDISVQRQKRGGIVREVPHIHHIGRVARAKPGGDLVVIAVAISLELHRHAGMGRLERGGDLLLNLKGFVGIPCGKTQGLGLGPQPRKPCSQDQWQECLHVVLPCRAGFTPPWLPKAKGPSFAPCRQRNASRRDRAPA